MNAIAQYNQVRDRETNATMGRIDHRVMMFIEGVEVSSSCIYSGPLFNCNRIAKRRNADISKHPSVSYRVLHCIQ